MASERGVRGVAALVLLLTLASVLLHLKALDNGLPHLHEPDAALVGQARMMRGEVPRNYHGWAKYPHLLSRVMAVAPQASAVREHPPEEALEAHLEFAGRSYRTGRLVSLLISALVIPFTWLFALRFFSPGWALLAAGFAASSLLLANFSVQARPHAPLASLFVLAVHAACLVAERGSARRCAWAAATAALALGALHTGGFVLGAGLVAYLWARKDGSGRGVRQPLIIAGILFTGLLLFYPFLFDRVTAWTEDSRLSDYADFPHRVRVNRFNGGGFARMAGFLFDYDPVLVVFAALGGGAGMLRLMRRSPAAGAVRAGAGRDVVVALGALLPLALVFGIYDNAFARFLTPFWPFLACLAAAGVKALTSRLGGGQRLGLTLGLLALAFPTYAVLELARIRRTPDTWTEAAEWALNELDRETDRAVMHPWVSPPIFSPVGDGEAGTDAASERTKQVWSKYQKQLAPGVIDPEQIVPIWPFNAGGRVPAAGLPLMHDADSCAALLAELGATHVLVGAGVPFVDRVHELVRGRGELVAQFAPWELAGGEKPSHPFGLMHQGPRFWRLVLRARTSGPFLWAYRLH